MLQRELLPKFTDRRTLLPLTLQNRKAAFRTCLLQRKYQGRVAANPYDCQPVRSVSWMPTFSRTTPRFHSAAPHCGTERGSFIDLATENICFCTSFVLGRCGPTYLEIQFQHAVGIGCAGLASDDRVFLLRFGEHKIAVFYIS